MANKALGQHWLHDNDALQAMVGEAGVETGETVLEIGPGHGTLTRKLIAAGAQVIAVEKDLQLVEKLRQQDLPAQIIGGDILNLDLRSLPPSYKLVANIPYYITHHLLRLLCETTHKPDCAVMLVQKEVAERVAAKPGDLSVVAVATQLHYEVSLGRVVGAELFNPAPKVDSQILVLKKRPKPLFDVEEKQFMKLVKAGFAARRKTLENSLSAGLQMTKEQTGAILSRANIAPSRRAQSLSMNDWLILYKVISLH